MKSRPDRPDYAHIDRRYRPRQRAIGLPSVGGRGHGRRRSRFWPWGWVAVLLCLVIGMSRGGAIAALDPLAQRIPPGPNESGAVVVANPTIATEGETQPIDQASDFPTSADASISSSSVTELRLQGHHRQAIGMVLRSLGVPEVLTRTLQREDFPRLTLIAIGLEPLDNSEKFDRNTFPARVAMAVEAGHRLSEDQRLQLRELADSFQAIGELDLVEPLLRYLLDTSDRDGERAALYERLGSFHGAQAQWHENYQEDLTTAQYQAALAAYDQASSLVQGDRDARLRLQIARLRTELAEQRYGMQNLPTDLEDYAELPDLTARLNTLAQGFHTVYRELVNTQQDTATPQTIAMQLDLASQLACLHSLASPTVQTLGAAPTVRHCAAPNWPQPLPIAAQILDDRRDLLARATRDSVALSEQQPPDTLAAMIAQRFQVQALLLTGDIAAGELTPSIVAETIGKLEQSLDKPESMELPDLRVQLLWQAGRIAIAADQPKLARQYYAQAITEFQPLRIDLGSLTLDWRYNFRDAIAPLYQDYLALLLPPPEASPMTHNDPSVGLAVPTDSQDLETAIATLQGLQLAELDDFFGEACAIPEQFKIEQLDREEYRHVALLATVVLPDRTETILTFLNDRTTPTTTSSDPPSRQWLRYSAPVRQSGVRIELEQLLESLKDSNGFRIDKRTQEVYQHYMQAAIAGMEAVTPPNTIDTILFLPDGGFRSIPLGALRASADDPYLVERYDIAVIPSFDLITIDPENQVRSRLRTLAVGRSKFENTPASSRSTSRLSVTIAERSRLCGKRNSGYCRSAAPSFLSAQ
ncbi:MAG: CHAT domain-containing protein [Oscillatoriales cyanobacterium]|nr:MAG: CHAT domain-containing protein [Oscillatoriales cyanobacterium]